MLQNNRNASLEIREAFFDNKANIPGLENLFAI